MDKLEEQPPEFLATRSSLKDHPLRLLGNRSGWLGVIGLCPVLVATLAACPQFTSDLLIFAGLLA